MIHICSCNDTQEFAATYDQATSESLDPSVNQGDVATGKGGTQHGEERAGGSAEKLLSGSRRGDGEQPTEPAATQDLTSRHNSPRTGPAPTPAPRASGPSPPAR